jgi:hypothetical protein
VLVFVLALQSPEASQNWQQVSRFCERTVRSVCAQSCQDFRVFLVCNQRPTWSFNHPALTIIEDKFPIPDPDILSRMRDKCLKVKVGLIAARHHAPAHVMIVDADDCVHRDLAALARKWPSAHGWIFDVGYCHDEGTRWLLLWKDFDQYCGTSAIVRLERCELPNSLCEANDHYFILSKGHERIRYFLHERGTPLLALPFTGAIYITGSGENTSGFAVAKLRGKRMMLRRLIWSRPLTHNIRSVFGLYDLPRSCLSSAGT